MVEIGVGVALAFGVLIWPRLPRPFLWIGFLAGVILVGAGLVRELRPERQADALLTALSVVPNGVHNLEGQNALQADYYFLTQRNVVVHTQKYGLSVMPAAQAEAVREFNQLGGLVPEYGEPTWYAGAPVRHFFHESAPTIDREVRNAIYGGEQVIFVYGVVTFTIPGDQRVATHEWCHLYYGGNTDTGRDLEGPWESYRRTNEKGCRRGLTRTYVR